MKPLGDKVVTDPVKPWYSSQPCGENRLATMVKSMFSKIGIVGKSNHSLRVTGASNLFQAGVPEKIIQERTGHRSLKALRMYERTTTSQHIAVSNVLSAVDTSVPGLKPQVPNPVSTVFGTVSKPQVPNPVSTMFGTVSNCVINVNMTAPIAPSDV